MKNDNVLIIDDLIATGGTAEAAAKLIEISKSNVAGFIFVINFFDLVELIISFATLIAKKGYKVENPIYSRFSWSLMVSGKWDRTTL